MVDKDFIQHLRLNGDFIESYTDTEDDAKIYYIYELSEELFLKYINMYWDEGQISYGIGFFTGKFIISSDPDTNYMHVGETEFWKTENN